MKSEQELREQIAMLSKEARRLLADERTVANALANVNVGGAFVEFEKRAQEFRSQHYCEKIAILDKEMEILKWVLGD